MFVAFSNVCFVQVNPIINAVVVKNFDEARSKAREVDAQIIDATDHELDEVGVFLDIKENKE